MRTDTFKDFRGGTAKPSGRRSLVVVVTALEVERRAVCSVFDLDHSKREKWGPRTYWRGSVGSYDVALCQGVEMGNQEALSITKDAIAAWKPEIALFVGIAGSVRKGPSLGDVVVCTAAWYLEGGKVTPSGVDPQPHQLSCDRLLIERAKALADFPDWRQSIFCLRPEGLQKRSEVRYAPSVAVERVIADSTARDRLISIDRKIAALNMEDYGFVNACHASESPVRCLIFRGISDDATSAKEDVGDVWHQYAAEAAASLAKHFLLDDPLRIAETMGRGCVMGPVDSSGAVDRCDCATVSHTIASPALVDGCAVPILRPIPELTPRGWNDGVDLRQSGLAVKWMDWLQPLTLEQMISGYPSIELQLRDNLRRSLKRVLRHQGWKQRGRCLTTGGFLVQADFDPEGLRYDCRRPNLVIGSMAPGPKVEVCVGREITAIGSIRQLALKYLSGAGVDARQILDVLSEEVEDAYRALEEMFVVKVRNVSDCLFAAAYKHLEVGLRSTYGEERGIQLFRQCWLAVSDGEFSVYSLCGDSVAAMASRLKDAERQREGRSPFWFLSVLVTQAFSFKTTFGRRALGKKKPVHSPWGESNYISTAPLAYAAELALYSSEELSVYSCPLNDRFSWGVACPRPAADEVMAEVGRLRDTLQRLLGEGVLAWSAYISSMVSRAAGVPAGEIVRVGSVPDS